MLLQGRAEQLAHTCRDVVFQKVVVRGTFAGHQSSST